MVLLGLLIKGTYYVSSNAFLLPDDRQAVRVHDFRCTVHPVRSLGDGERGSGEKVGEEAAKSQEI